MTWLRAAILLRFALGAALLSMATAAQALMCGPQSLEEDIADADAIMTGTVVAVRYVRNSLTDVLCWQNEPGHETCGAKIATVKVGRAWKGTPPAEVKVYALDSCYCHGPRLAEGDEMLFIVERYVGVKSPSINPDYQAPFCGRTMPVEKAKESGIFDHLEN